MQNFAPLGFSVEQLSQCIEIGKSQLLWLDNLAAVVMSARVNVSPTRYSRPLSVSLRLVRILVTVSRLCSSSNGEYLYFSAKYFPLFCASGSLMRSRRPVIITRP